MVVAAAVTVAPVVAAGRSAGDGGCCCCDERVYSVHPEHNHSLPAAKSHSLSMSEGVCGSMLVEERVSQSS